MAISPTLTAILPVPGIETTPGARPDEGLSVGVVVNGERITWGVCPSAGLPPVAGQPELWAPLQVDAAVETINNVLAPRLLGRSLAGFRQLVAGLDEVTETVTVPKRRPKPSGEAKESKEKEPVFSRRALITGRLVQENGSDEAKPPVEYETVERLIHPAIRYGISQALLAAMARERGATMADVIAAEYDLDRPEAAVPLQAVIRAGQSLRLLHRVGSLAYASGRTDPAGELGNDAEKLQRFVRRLKERLVAARDASGLPAAGLPAAGLPALHLVLGGGLGRLYDNATGKILGALYGLQGAADPCPLYVEDPLLMGSRQAQIEALVQLADYVRLRQIPVGLAAGLWIDTLDDVAAFVGAFAQAIAGNINATVMPEVVLRLNMARLGTIHNTIEAALICRKAGIGILLEGAPLEVAVEVAMAIQPDWLVTPADSPGDAGIAAVHNALARAGAWNRTRRGELP